MDIFSALSTLRDSDHVFLKPDAARNIAQSLGVGRVLVMQRVKVNSRDPKGLTVPGVRDGVAVEGYDAAALAKTICRALGVEYDDKFGRGSQLCACCDSLDAHFKTSTGGA